MGYEVLKSAHAVAVDSWAEACYCYTVQPSRWSHLGGWEDKRKRLIGDVCEVARGLVSAFGRAADAAEWGRI